MKEIKKLLVLVILIIPILVNNDVYATQIDIERTDLRNVQPTTVYAFHDQKNILSNNVVIRGPTFNITLTGLLLYIPQNLSIIKKIYISDQSGNIISYIYNNIPSSGYIIMSLLGSGIDINTTTSSSNTRISTSKNLKIYIDIQGHGGENIIVNVMDLYGENINSQNDQGTIHRYNLSGNNIYTIMRGNAGGTVYMPMGDPMTIYLSQHKGIFINSIIHNDLFFDINQNNTEGNVLGYSQQSRNSNQNILGYK